MTCLSSSKKVLALALTLATWWLAMAPELHAQEPSLSATALAAIHHHRLDTDFAGLASRARWSGLVPTFSIRARVDDGWQNGVLFRESQLYDAQNRAVRDQGRIDADREEQTATMVEARASFELGLLVYNPQEVRIAQADRARWMQRQTLVKLVQTAYVARHKALLLATWSLRIEGPDSQQWQTHQLHVDLHTQELDLLTGGWFSTH